MKTLETQRLLLSAWRKKDAADLYEYAKNPNVGPHAGWKPHGDVKESRQIIKTLFIPNGVWAIRDRESGRAIGTISLEEDKYRPGIILNIFAFRRILGKRAHDGSGKGSNTLWV